MRAIRYCLSDRTDLDIPQSVNERYITVPPSSKIFHSSFFIALAAGAWSATLVYSIVSGRVLYGDGSLFVLDRLTHPHTFNDYDFQRTFASLISQAPILLGQKMGFDSVMIFAALYSFGIFVIPAIMMGVALFLSRKQPVLFAANSLAILVYGFGINFINSEANLFFGFVWLSVTLLAQHEANPLLRGVLLPTLAFALLRTYEGMLLVGPILALWAIIAANRTKEHIDQIGLILAGLLFLLGAIIGFGGFLSPRDPNNASAFISNAFFYFRNPHVFIFLSGLVYVFGYLLPNRRLRLISMAMSALLGMGFLIMLVKLDGYYSYLELFTNRAFLVLFLPVFVGICCAIFCLRPEWLLPGTMSYYKAFLIPFGIVLLGDGVITYSWNFYTMEFCKVLAIDVSPQKRIEALVDSGVKMGWTWNHPTMSLLLRDRGSMAIVANQTGAFNWEPFKPEEAPSFDYHGLCAQTISQ